LTGSRSGSTSTSSRKRRPARPAGGAAHRPKKRFGQHFLSDPNILNRISDAAEIELDSTVVEIGPGLGALTAVLAERAAHVIAVEVDRDLIASLRERFPPTSRVTIVERDALAVEPAALLRECAAGPPYLVVANLPYNVAAPVLRLFLEAGAQPERMVVMVQLEVGEAIVAKSGHMGLLSVGTQVYADTQMVMKVAPGAFHPPPKVQSAVVRLDVAPRPKVDVPLDMFFRVVRAGFGNPRKQLRNSLSFGLHVKQEVIDGVMSAAGIDVMLRPQMLSLDDWAAITHAWIARPQS
jgi:16S rRNA (adenine1518-N6/adenine1519-N6)-dimethyltransferase